MTFVREEENGNNGHHAGGVWRGGRCPSFLDTRAGALARFGRIDRRVQRPSDSKTRPAIDSGRILIEARQDNWFGEAA
jgi:hypothetical protein